MQNSFVSNRKAHAAYPGCRFCYEPNLKRARVGFGRLQFAIPGRSSGHERAEQFGGCLRDFVDRTIKGLFVHSRWFTNPLIFLTNCRAAARTSLSVAGGSKLYSTLMFLHTLSTSLIGYCRRVPQMYGGSRNSCFHYILLSLLGVCLTCPVYY
jgi:hypothetical protein